MHVPYRLAEKIASAGAARQLAWVAWGISVSLILSATVIRSLERINLLQFVDSICAGVAFGLFATVGALIAWQRPRNTIGWIFCAVGIGTGITDFSGAYTTYGMMKGHLPLPGADIFNWLGNIVWPVNWVLFLVFLPLLFPNGHLLTRRWRIVGWLAAILALLSILTGALSVVTVELFGKVIPADFWDSLASNINLLELPLAIAALVSLVLRFNRAKERERQQIKWLTYGSVLMAVLIVSGIFVLKDETNFTFDIAIMFLPLSIGISILRDQLYDIDRLISRTLLYLLLSALLVLTYLVLVFGLQFVLQGITRDSPVPLVVSTLAVAALFQPLRRAIQRVIDRRFYRRKYNAQLVLTGFGATLRNEIDLTQLSEQLLAVVEETMQPAHVSLWLRKPERKFSYANSKEQRNAQRNGPPGEQ
jgi:hypothetical protein